MRGVRPGDSTQGVTNVLLAQIKDNSDDLEDGGDTG